MLNAPRSNEATTPGLGRDGAPGGRPLPKPIPPPAGSQASALPSSATAGWGLSSCQSRKPIDVDVAVMISLQVFYEGNVQGVGFRWSVRHIATGFDVTGWVRNLHDGRVELQVAGEESEVFSFLDAIKTSELASHIRRQQEMRLEDRKSTRL